MRLTSITEEPGGWLASRLQRLFIDLWQLEDIFIISIRLRDISMPLGKIHTNEKLLTFPHCLGASCHVRELRWSGRKQGHERNSSGYDVKQNILNNLQLACSSFISNVYTRYVVHTYGHSGPLPLSTYIWYTILFSRNCFPKFYKHIQILSIQSSSPPVHHSC